MVQIAVLKKEIKAATDAGEYDKLGPLAEKIKALEGPPASTVPSTTHFHAVVHAFSRCCSRIFTLLFTHFHAAVHAFSRCFWRIFTHSRL